MFWNRISHRKLQLFATFVYLIRIYLIYTNIIQTRGYVFGYKYITYVGLQKRKNIRKYLNYELHR